MKLHTPGAGAAAAARITLTLDLDLTTGSLRRISRIQKEERVDLIVMRSRQDTIKIILSEGIRDRRTNIENSIHGQATPNRSCCVRCTYIVCARASPWTEPASGYLRDRPPSSARSGTEGHGLPCASCGSSARRSCLVSFFSIRSLRRRGSGVEVSYYHQHNTKLRKTFHKRF